MVIVIWLVELDSKHSWSSILFHVQFKLRSWCNYIIWGLNGHLRCHQPLRIQSVIWVLLLKTCWVNTINGSAALSFYFFKKLIVALSLIVCHLTPFTCNNNLNAFGVYRNEHGFFFNREKEKRNCFAIMLLSVNWPLHLHKNVQMYIIMKTAIVMIVMMLYRLGNRFWQEDDFFFFLLIVNFTCIPPLGSATFGDNAPPCLHGQWTWTCCL